MVYLNSKGDLDKTAQKPSILIFNNWAKERPKFCFIIPTYKRADLLEYAINSCLKQEDFLDCEILVLDDNPERRDETEILMTGKYDIPGIAFYKNAQNLKQEGNWNKLFYHARTEWMIMLHDDDMLYPDCLNYLRQCMSLYSSEVKAFFPSFIGSKFMGDQLPKREKNNIIARRIKEFDFLQGYIVGAPVGMCVNREAVIEIGGVNETSSVAVDFDFCVRLSRIGTIVKQYGYPLGAWRIMENVSQSKNTVLKCLEYGDVLMQDVLEDLGLNVFQSIYARYLKVFDNQHICSWYKQWEKGIPLKEDMKETNLLDRVTYLVLRTLFVIQRHLRTRKRTMKIQ